MSRLPWKVKVYYHSERSPPLLLNLSHINPIPPSNPFLLSSHLLSRIRSRPFPSIFPTAIHAFIFPALRAYPANPQAMKTFITSLRTRS